MADADLITRLNAALEGRYRIGRELGEGGMATVYLADDLKHERKVALKVLKPELAAVVGADRFLAEIRTTANLQHPHILGLHDSGEANGLLFYVMPYVEGESLRDRLDREHQLPVEDAVRIATNLAEALDYAHRQGVIHRDIKPANVLLQDGKPVISDFGIALAVGVAGGGRLTETGLSLGTPHYMSPEQATGDLKVGPPTDIYALGCVLYEMLVGEPPYTGSTPQAVLGKIVTGEPPSVTEERSTVPAHVDAVVRRALEKVPADRFGAAGEMGRAMGDPAFRWGEGAASSHRPASSLWNPLSVGLAVSAVLLALGWTVSSSREEPPEVGYFELLLPDGLVPTTNQTNRPLSISADGSRVGIRLQDDDGVGQVWLRDITTSVDPIHVPTLDGPAGSIALSSDGAWIAYHDPAAAAIRQAPALGTRPLTVGPTGLRTNDSGGFTGLAYGPDGSIVFGTREGLSRLPAGGGDPETLTSVGDEAVSHRDPSFLPDGSGILFTELVQTSRAQRLMILRFGDDAPTFVTEGHSGRVTPDGILVYGRGGWQDRNLSVARLNASWSSLEGESITIIEGIDERAPAETPQLMYDRAEDGTLVYLPHDPFARWQVVLVDRESGAETVVLDQSDPRFPAGITGLGQARFSPDGQRIALRARFRASPNFQLFTYDLARDLLAPVRVDEDADWPVWSADGERIAFNRFRSGAEGQNLYWARADNAEPPEPLIPENTHQQHAQEFTQDGRYLVYIQRDVQMSNDSDIWLLPLDGSRPARPLVDREGHQRSASISPDARWMAYISNESGSYQVYLTEFPEPRTWRQVTTEPALNPVWSPTGEELYYMREEDRSVFAVSVGMENGIDFGEPELVAAGPFGAWTWFGRGIDVRSDGTLLLTRSEDPPPPPAIVVIRNFDELARQLLDSGG